MYDPFAPAFTPKRNRKQSVDFTPEQSESLVARATKPILSGISAVGNVLDLPGSMVRDTLAGKNPFDQLLDPLGREAETNRTSGRSLARSWGVAGDEDTWGNAIGGFGLEVALDPLTYATFGASALSKSGKVAKAAGLMDDAAKVAAKKAGKAIGTIGKREARSTLSLNDLLNPANFRTPKSHQEAVGAATRAADKMGVRLSDIGGDTLGGTLALGIPGTGQSITFTTGARRMDDFARKVRGLEPVKGLYSLLHAPSKGRGTLEGQELAQRITRRQKKAEGAIRTEIAQDAMKLKEMGLTDDAASWNIRSAGEGIPTAVDPSGLGVKYADQFKESLQANQALGKKSSERLDDVIKYMARSAGDSVTGRDGAPLALKDPTALERKQALKGFAKGTQHLNEVITDPAIGQIIDNSVGVPRKDLINQVADYIYNTHGQYIEPVFHRRKGGKLQYKDSSGQVVGLSKKQISAGTVNNGKLVINGNTFDPVMQDRFPVIAKWIIDHPSARENGLFTNNVLSDTRKRLISDKRWQEAADEVYDFMADRLKYTTPSDGVPLSRVVKQMGVDSDEALINIANRMGVTPDQIKKSKIDKEVANDLLSLTKSWTAPDAASKAGKFIDSATNLFKVGVLTTPRRYVRDFVSGAARNMESGMWDLPSAIQAHKLSFGKTIDAHKIPIIEDMLRQNNLPVTAEEGSKMLRSLYAGLGPGGNTVATDVAGKTPTPSSSLGDLLGEIPGNEEMSAAGLVGSMAKTLAGKDGKASWTDYKNYFRGVGGAKESKFPIVAVGDRVGHYTDEMNRLVPFINQLKKGVDPYEAMNRINAAQVNYAPDAFTPTEKQLKRLFPFWSFSSRQVPYMVKTLAEKPGGKMAQSIRAMNNARDTDNVTPDYVAESASIPIGTLPDGSNRYVTGLGLMTEDPLSLVPTSLRGGLMEAASRTNPLIKAPLEYMTGESFFQRGPNGGRPLEDMDPLLGRTVANVRELMGAPHQDRVRPIGGQLTEHLIANSPLSQLLTTARTATDSRKLSNPTALATNLLSGVRMSDISPAAQEAMLREQIQEQMKKLGARTFSNIYMPEEELARLDPKEQEAALTLKAIMKELQDRAKERKRQRQLEASSL